MLPCLLRTNCIDTVDLIYFTCRLPGNIRYIVSHFSLYSQFPGFPGFYQVLCKLSYAVRNSQSLSCRLKIFALCSVSINRLSLISFILQSTSLNSSCPRSILRTAAAVRLCPTIILSCPSTRPTMISCSVRLKAYCPPVLLYCPGYTCYALTESCTRV